MNDSKKTQKKEQEWMAKPHAKLIYILTTLLIVSTVLLLSSCGQNNPVSAKAPNAVMGPNGAVGGCTPSIPLGRLDPKMYWPASGSIPPASIADLLKAPNANPNASGAPARFDSLCGSYYEFAHFHRGPETGWIDHDTGGRKWILDNSPSMYMINFYTISNTPTGYDFWGRANPSSAGLQPNPPLRYYFLDCTLFPPGMMLPSDFFTGNGYPDGDYVYGGDWFNKFGGTVTPKGRVTPCTPDGPYPPPKPKTLTNITIDPPTQTVGVGQTASFSAIAHYSDGSTQDVTANSATLWSTQISGTPNAGTGLAYTAPATTTSTNKNTPSGLSAPSAMTAPTKPGIFTSSVQAVMTIIAEYTEGGVKKSAQATATFDKKSIQITPLQATIYIHHTNPDKKQQQFIAKDGNGTDVTQQLSWDTSDATVANISNFDIHKGLAFVGNKAGTVKISATDTPTGIKSSPDAELSVMCWQHTFYSQIDSAWKDYAYAYHINDPPGSQVKLWDSVNGPVYSGTIGGVGCSMVTYAMVLTTATGYVIYKPDMLNQLMTDLKLYDRLNNYTQRRALTLFGNGIIKTATSTDYSEAWIDELKKCNMILAHIRAKNSNGHYVLLISYSPLPNGGGYFLAYDPWRDGVGFRTIDPLDIVNDGGSTLITF